jgi:hypothetical protein
MYSTRCPSCSQIITLKTEEIREAVSAAEAAGHPHYTLSCPKCRRPVKMPVKLLKLKLPRPSSTPESGAQ